MSHQHSHSIDGNRLRNALILTVVILLIEIVGGLVANSLALLSDAGHILTDVFALGLAWFATILSVRGPTAHNTFGYRRSSILVAQANAALLLVIAVAIVVEAALRIQHPEHVTGAILIPAALAAIAVNTYIALGLRSHRSSNLNIRAAFLHVVGDIAASVGVVIAGIAIVFFRVYIFDPILSAAIALLIAIGAWNIVRDTLSILMEGIPRGLDLEEMRQSMLQVPGVEDIHDLHVWALSDGYRLLTAHVTIPEQSLADAANLVANLKSLLHRRFQIEHATIEIECIDCRLPPRLPLPLYPRQ